MERTADERFARRHVQTPRARTRPSTAATRSARTAVRAGAHAASRRARRGEGACASRRRTPPRMPPRLRRRSATASRRHFRPRVQERLAASQSRRGRTTWTTGAQRGLAARGTRGHAEAQLVDLEPPVVGRVAGAAGQLSARTSAARVMRRASRRGPLGRPSGVRSAACCARVPMSRRASAVARVTAMVDPRARELRRHWASMTSASPDADAPPRGGSQCCRRGYRQTSHDSTRSWCTGRTAPPSAIRQAGMRYDDRAAPRNNLALAGDEHSIQRRARPRGRSLSRAMRSRARRTRFSRSSAVTDDRPERRRATTKVNNRRG